MRQFKNDPIIMPRDRAFRRAKQESKWITRTRKWMVNWGFSFIIDRDGNKIHNPTITDCLNDSSSKVYKTTGTPCSCPACSPYKYDRAAAKKDANFEINQD